MKRTISKMLGISALAIAGMVGSLLATTPAQAATTVTCLPYDINNVTYPTDGAATTPHTNGHAYRCASSPGGLKPTDARADTLFQALRSGQAGFPFPTIVRSKLLATNVRYFFFNNRAEANNYFANTAPYNSIGFLTRAKFVSPDARCGNTGYGWNGIFFKEVVVSIYDKCTFTTGQVSNPSLERTAFHETGHAFDFSYAPNIAETDNILSEKSGFQSLGHGDFLALDPLNWTTLSNIQKDNYVCKLFSPTTKPSTMEFNLAGTPGTGMGLGDSMGRVCTGSSVRTLDYMTKTPSLIAKDKIPYFIEPNYSDLFAEIFVVEAFATGSPAAFLQMTDRILANNAIVGTVTGANDPNHIPTTYRRSFNCTRAVLKAYITTGQPPTSLPAGCPAPTGF